MMDIGAYAERKAAIFLNKKGYDILDVNYKTRHGEIDLIVRNRKEIIFVEVKARSENSYAEPKEFVQREKQKKIIAASQRYIMNHNCKLQPRYDVVEVYFEKDEIKSVKHLENAFTLD